MSHPALGRRSAPFILVGWFAIAVAFVGCSASYSGGGEVGSGPEVAAPPATTEATTGAKVTAAPPATTKPVAGTGRETGTAVRAMMIAEYAFGEDAPADATSGGISIGSRVADCEHIDPAKEFAGIVKAIGDPVQLTDPAVLVARCGDTVHALAMWRDGTAIAANQFQRTSTGAWKEADGDGYAGCSLPDDVKRLWKLTVIDCDG